MLSNEKIKEAGNNMHEAILYKKMEGNKVLCTACKQKCIIADEFSGMCGVRQNKGGKLYLLVYGRASAVNIDPVEKKPLYHFLPGTKIFSIGTLGCNFSCAFCQNWDISQASKDIKLRLMKEQRQHKLGAEIRKYGYELQPEKIIDMCKYREIQSIAYTYNEPAIFFEYAYDTAKLAEKKGIKNVMVSNGYESEEAMQMLIGHIDAINIDLKAFSNGFYQAVCSAKLDNVLDTIRLVHKSGIWIEITTLLIPDKNDSSEELKGIAEFIASIDRNIPWHVTAFHPDYKMTDIHPTNIDSLQKTRNIGKDCGLKYVYTGNIIDAEGSNTYCPNCKALLIRRSGYSVNIEALKNGKCVECKEKIPGAWK